MKLHRRASISSFDFDLADRLIRRVKRLVEEVNRRVIVRWKYINII